MFIFFCLMNLMMINQTIQCWSSDSLSESLKSENKSLIFFCVLSVIIVQFRFFFNYNRCIKVNFGAVTFFGKRVILFVHVQKFE